MRLNLLTIFLLIALIFLQYRLWFESGSVTDMLQLKKRLALQLQQNEKLKKDNETLLFQVERLKKSDDAAESRARNEMGMIKKGETFYQIVK